MPRLSRRATLAAAATATLPRFAIAQADTRPAITVAVQRIATSNTLDIVYEASNVGTRHYNLYEESLIDTDWTGDLSLRPGLATGWRRIDDRTIEFSLRPGVRFHNGDEMTAEDVAWSFGERLFGTTAEQTSTAPVARRDPRWAPTKVRSVAKVSYPALERVEIVDRNTVRWVNRVPDVTLEGRISMRTGSILSARSWHEATTWFDWARRPIGTGPYRVAEYKPETMLLLEAFDDYWGGRPPARSVRFVEVPELASRINGLLAGEYDFACDVTPDQIPLVEKSPRHEVVGGLIPNIRVLVMDKHHPTLVDPRIRQAISHAIDRQAIVDSIWNGRTRVPKGLQFEFYGPMYISDWSVPAYDQSLARTLARASGYVGDPIPFKVLSNYYTNQVATAQIVSEMCQAAGLNVQIEMRENWAQVEGRDIVRGINDNSESAFFNDPVSFMPSSFGPKGELVANGYWQDTEAETLLDVLQTNTGLEPRRAAFRRLLEIVERDDPALTVLHETANFTAKRRDLLWKPSKSFVMDFRARNFSVTRG
jgi:peptide/nickel transport system substrate-binding protein